MFRKLFHERLHSATVFLVDKFIEKVASAWVVLNLEVLRQFLSAVFSRRRVLCGLFSFPSLSSRRRAVSHGVCKCFR